jgi:uncharacterized protein YndB with AHSA1/START domain
MPETHSLSGPHSENGLLVDRIFAAPRALVWSAWTKPEMLVRWLGPMEWPSISATQDLTVGGRWSATLQNAEGSTLEQTGEYREIVPFKRLVFTFKWVGDHEDGEPVDTLVTVDLWDTPSGHTQMRFEHQFLKSEASLAGHRHGWMDSFNRLDRWLISRGDI